MKEICIFIGSSVDKREFELERERIGSFINGLNRKFVHKGIFIDLYDCEQVTPKMHAEGSQKQHDEYIENKADVTFFLFFRKAGEFTLHELQLAHDTLVKLNRPDVFTYFKVIGEDIEDTDEIKKAVALIADSYGHYFSKFSDVDTVKLGMLQYITQKLDDYSEVSVSDGKILLNNKEVDGISLENIFAYQNNREYNELKDRIKNLEKEISELIEQRNFDNIEALTVEKEECEKLLAKLEADILKMLIEMQKELRKSNPDPTVVKAYQLLEIGRHKEALRLIPLEVLREKDRVNQLNAELNKEQYSIVVDAAKARISALEADINNPKRFEMIEETYDSVIESAFLAEENEFIYDAVLFLKTQNKTQKAYDLGRRLEGLYLLKPSLGDTADRACLYNELGIICGDLTGKQGEAEKYNNAAIELCQSLAKNNPDKYNAALAVCYINSGVFYGNQGNHKKAEEYFLAAIEISKELAEKDYDSYSAVLACSYNNAGFFYDHQGNFEKAEEFYLAAIEISKELAEKNPDRYNADLAGSYNNAGFFYDEQGNFEKAEKYYLAAIEIVKTLVEKNPDRYSADLATSYGSAGVFYDDQGNPEKAEKYYLAALEIRKELAEKNPDKYNSDLAHSYNNVGAFYDNQGNPEKAEEYFLVAIEISKELAEMNPDRYSADLAMSYYNYGIFKDDSEYFEKAYKLAKQNMHNPYCRQIVEEIESEE